MIERIQPSQFYVDSRKKKVVENFIHSEEEVIIPLVKYGDRYISMDGHTRMSVAIDKGFKSVKGIIVQGDDWLYNFVREAVKRNIKSPYELEVLSHEEYDINLAWNFMVDVYDNRFSNGVAAPFFEYALTSAWMDKSYLHLDRLWLDGEKVVAFVFSENPVTSVFFSLRPGYEELAEEMLDYAEQNIPNFDNEREFVLFADQKVLIEEAEKRGYKVAWENVDLIFDFAKAELNYELPKGFHFVDPLNADPVKLAECMWKGFDHEDKGPFENWADKDDGAPWNPQKAYNGVFGSTIAPPPHSTYEYNVIIANEKEEYVCFSGMWWIEKNKLAYMEPLCTVPACRGLGLAAAALSEHCRRLKPLGAEMMTGGGNDFYKKIGYEDGIHWLHYKKN